MANVLVNDASLADIADAIREKNGTEETYKPAEMGAAVRAIEIGDNFYDAFWDAYQENGNRTDYISAFGNNNNSVNIWNDSNFKPKYDIKPVEAANMFYNSRITDLVKILEEQGVVLDTSKVKTNTTYMFSGCGELTTVPPIDFTSTKYLTGCFIGCKKLKKITLLNFHSDIQIKNNPFNGCEALEELVITGEIGMSVSLVQSPLLNNTSVQNIIDCLADMTGQTAQTLTLHTDVKAKLTETQIAAITGKNWTLA